MARDPDTNEVRQPTVGFLRGAYKAGRLATLDEPENARTRQGRFALLDPDACVDRDPRSVWRQSLAARADRAGIAMTDAACFRFLHSVYGREPDDLAFPMPSASALRR